MAAPRAWPSFSAESALRRFDREPPDLSILDLGLPGLDGLELCERLRRHGYHGPILMLTARHEVTDRVRGLDAGADDYLVKPFALDELLARVRAMLRRRVRSGVASTNLLLGDVELDVDTREVRRGGDLLDLTKLEFDLLRVLMEASPIVMTRASLHEQVWGFEEDHMSNSLEVFVSQLRKKMEADGGQRLIHTVRGVGYVARTT